MADFITGGGTVADGKSDATALSVPANKGITAAEWNEAMAALYAVRKHVLGNWVNVKSHGAIGDGVTDDSTAIAAAITAAGSACTLFFPEGIYLVTSTQTIASDDVLVTGAGATLKYTTGVGSNGRVFAVGSGRARVKFRGLTFLGPAAASFAGSEQGCIHIDSATDCEVADCLFSLSTSDMDAAIFNKGTTNSGTRILRNRIEGSGIVYSYGGASRALCIGNHISASLLNALSGTGNDSGNPNYDCVVAENVIVNAGRMGIEDFSNTQRTIIRGNSVNATGLLSATGYGISVVGRNTLVEGNSVIDFETYGIEAAGNGMRIVGNSIRQIGASFLGTAIGIVVNGHDSGQPHGAIVENNYIDNTDSGISTINDHGPLVIQGNHIEEPGYGTGGFGIDASGSSTYGPLIQGNHIRFARPNNDAGNLSRSGIAATEAGGAGKMRAARIIGNTVIWESATNGGTSTGADRAYFITALDSLILGNYAHSNSATDAGGAPYFYVSNGATSTGLVFIGNTALGGTQINVTNLTTPVLLLNNGNSHAGGNGVLGFYDKDNASLVAKQTVTGSRGANAALADLLTKLANLGLIVDSSS